MLIKTLLVAHIAVLGYWLGSELVINHTFRYVSWARGMNFAERNRLLDLVMDVDQHVRYALILQAGLGTALGALYGYFGGGTALAWTAFAITAAWFVFVEVIHRCRKSAMGGTLSKIDRVSRYLLVAALFAYGIFCLNAASSTVPNWLAWKLIGFGLVIASGLGIRLALIDYFQIWRRIEVEGSNDENERAIRRAYVKATSVLVGLWVFIAFVVYLSVWKLN